MPTGARPGRDEVRGKKGVVYWGRPRGKMLLESVVLKGLKTKPTRFGKNQRRGILSVLPREFVNLLRGRVRKVTSKGKEKKGGARKNRE